MLQADQLSDPVGEYTGRDLSASAMGVNSGRRPEGRDVAITDVQTTTVEGNFPWTLVRIYTDTGITGTGEAYWGAGIPQLIHRIKPFLIGENPLDIDRLYKYMIQRMSGEGSIQGVTVSAISGIEVALHDLAGKVLDVPVYQLLGGKYRDAVRIYCDCHAEREGDPGASAEEAKRVVNELGYDGIKFDLDLPSDHTLDRANRYLRTAEVEEKVTLIREVSRAVSPEAEVAFDCHWAFSRDSAIRLAQACEEEDVWWLEDPVPPENLDAQKYVTDRTRTPIAAGENVYRKFGQRPLIEKQAVDLLSPDLIKGGGLRETMKIAEFADMYYMPVTFHNVCSPVGTMATVHAAAALSNTLAVEFHSYKLDWWGDLIEEDILDEGVIQVPEEPGLGVTLDPDEVQPRIAEGDSLFDPS